MSFSKDIPDYKTLHSDKYYLNKAPDLIWDKIEAYGTRVSETASDLASVINQTNELTLTPRTHNWGYDFLVNDWSNSVFQLRKEVNKGKFNLLMDAIAIIAKVGFIEAEEINEFLKDQQIGYCISIDPLSRDYYWEVRSEIEDLSAKIETTKKIVQTQSQQAFEHFEQAKRQLENATNERARKDAVRDCASAMEAVIKILGSENDIKNASKKLRGTGVWGKDEIVKDGDAIFNTLHRLYPDLRHGSLEHSEMPLEEACYWMDRITAYITYMFNRKKTLDID